MSNSIFNIIGEKLWSKSEDLIKIQLFRLLLITAIVLLLTVANFVISLFNLSESCLACNIGIILASGSALFCVIRGKINCVLYIVYTIPLFIYGYYISDFSQHPPLSETIYLTVWWLIAGSIFLFYSAESTSITFFYFLLSLLTVILHLYRANYLIDSFSMYKPFIFNPIFVIIVFYIIFSLIRNKYTSTIQFLTENLKISNHRVSKVFQDSMFSIAEIKSEQDEDGNVTNLWIQRVNNSFESKFKINAYEVENQEADYIFNLIFRDEFDVNKTLFFQRNAIKEFYAKNLDKWFRIYILKPANNHFYLIFEDISKAKLKINKLEESKKRYKVLLEAIPDMYFVIDKDGTYEDFVIKESDLFKIEDANIIGSSIYDVGFPENMADRVFSLIRSCIKNNNLETIEYSLKTLNGTLMYEMRMAKLNSNSVIAISRDITSRKTIQFKLSKALKKAEESDRLKSAFLSNLSHEIRTPINIITNFTRMLSDPMVEEAEQTELSDAINQNGQQLLNMIENTIHLSKIETDTVEVNMKFCKINEMLREIYNHYMPAIPDSKNVKLILNLDVKNPDFGFTTDQLLLKETLTIFVDNAIKYTQNGAVKFGFEMIKNEAVKFSISDTGIGIPEEEKELIFSRFYRIKNNINETNSGSGIGLSIAEHYIQLLNGELQFESIPEKGTTFWFVLPFEDGKGYMRVV